jgi:hypothetical protein
MQVSAVVIFFWLPLEEVIGQCAGFLADTYNVLYAGNASELERMVPQVEAALRRLS